MHLRSHVFITTTIQSVYKWSHGNNKNLIQKIRLYYQTPNNLMTSSHNGSDALEINLLIYILGLDVFILIGDENHPTIGAPSVLLDPILQCLFVNVSQ